MTEFNDRVHEEKGSDQLDPFHKRRTASVYNAVKLCTQRKLLLSITESNNIWIVITLFRSI